MFDRLTSWFRQHVLRTSSGETDDLRQTGVRVRPPAERGARAAGRPAPAGKAKPAAKPDLRIDTVHGGRIEDAGPGKNVLVRSKYLREDTGTHEVLKIIDESIAAEEEDGGFDPYNTGRFDRSRNWNNRTRK